MKILIFTSKFGCGHFSAANALQEEFSLMGHSVIVQDILSVAYPKTYKRIYRMFADFVCKSPIIYNFVNMFGRKSGGYLPHSKNVTEAIEKIAPDMIITTWSGCSKMLDNIYIPTYVCITDIGVHSGWLYENAAGYMAANSEVKQKLMDSGVPEHKIVIHGMPVKQAFYKVKKSTGKCKNVLIMGGGLGILPWIDSLIDYLLQYSNISVTVITGNNTKLFCRLKEKYPQITVVGFTQEVHKYLAKADIFVSKPGGVSLFECIATATPFAAVYPQYTQEVENALFISRHKIGIVVHKGDNIGKRIVDILNYPAVYKLLRYNMEEMKQTIEQEKLWDKRGIHETAV